MIPTVAFWKRQNYGDRKKDQWLTGIQWAVGGRTGEIQIFKAVKLFCMILQWRTHLIMHLFKSTERVTPEVNPNINYNELCVTKIRHY